MVVVKEDACNPALALALVAAPVPNTLKESME